MSGHNIACWTLNFSELVLLKNFPLIDSKPWLKIELIRNFISELIDFRILHLSRLCTIMWLYCLTNGVSLRLCLPLIEFVTRRYSDYTYVCVTKKKVSL